MLLSLYVVSCCTSIVLFCSEQPFLLTMVLLRMLFSNSFMAHIFPLNMLRPPGGAYLTFCDLFNGCEKRG
jgi:hypothetical protein